MINEKRTLEYTQLYDTDVFKLDGAAGMHAFKMSSHYGRAEDQ